ncbi:site-specific integrase [Shewanella sp. Isolate7]|uniref:site-specific integrase n=1 Tax=Shewanella sp. Isolate7 TaxID=2908528 RepID=UPI001EFCF415|nr:site-specific integrase [Shewanella sp. Isolate7]MCG9721033.1 hypothetical protein [Shewanella sp. Isolate7]
MLHFDFPFSVTQNSNTNLAEFNVILLIQMKNISISFSGENGLEPIVSQRSDRPSLSDYKLALAKWESLTPPYSATHIQSCVTAAKKILAYDGKHRRSKYEKQSFLRIDFNKAGKVTYYTCYPPELGIRNRTLGCFPQLQPQVARIKAAEIANGVRTDDTVHGAFAVYYEDLKRKFESGALKGRSVETYDCRLKKLRLYFSSKMIFSEITISDLESVLQEIIANESANYANELYAELRRVWRFCAGRFADGNDVAKRCADDYVSSRVKRPGPCRLYTDLDSMSILWNKLALTSSLHQRNAVRYMIITGLRPVNVASLKWEWIDDESNPTKIFYPAGVMKNSKPFTLPVTRQIRQILKEQKNWRDNVAPSCNLEYVFLKPSEPMDGFSQRSLDALVKDYFPVDGVLGKRTEHTVKGRDGAFNTLCRKFVRSHVKAIFRQQGETLQEATNVARLCLHHSGHLDDDLL